ncbi:MAG: HAMP domain-containing sensor histidine kinase [Thermodesulfobacteriota bacterium]
MAKTEALSPQVVQALLRRERCQMVGRLLPGLVHNLSGAIQTLSLPLELVQAILPQSSSQELQDKFKPVQQGLDRLLAELEGLSARSRQDREVEPSLVDLAALAGEQLAFWRGDMFFKHQAQVESMLPLGLPLVQAAYADVALVFNVLVANALDAMRPAGEGQLTVSARKEKNQVCLLVTDSGPGPADKLAQKLFQPFVSDKPDHDGLGLFLARQALAPHGGQVAQRPGSPTTFVISLPAL